MDGTSFEMANVMLSRPNFGTQTSALFTSQLANISFPMARFYDLHDGNEEQIDGLQSLSLSA